MQNPMIEIWVQFMHLEKLYGYLPRMEEVLLARHFGLDLVLGQQGAEAQL